MLDALMLVMIHSPLVGPSTWQPCGNVLRRKGYQVRIPSLADFVTGNPPYYEKIARHVADAVQKGPDTETLILVGHSGAGALLPAVAERLDRQCYGIFVDAILPHPGLSWFDTAPPQLRVHLRGLVRDGFLPPWDRWFPPEVVSDLIPDIVARQRFIDELPRIPIAYLEERAPATRIDRLIQCAYLQLSDGYGAFARETEKAAWSILRESADHLAVLTQPEMVCDAIVKLLEAFAI